MAQTRSTNRAVTVHRLSSNWGEAGWIAGSGQGGGGIAQPGDATWDFAFWPNTSWQNAGGDFKRDREREHGDERVRALLVELDPTRRRRAVDARHAGANFGWLLRTDENVITTSRALHSRESASATDRPALVIGYLPPAARVTSVGSGCNGGGPSPLLLGASGLPRVPNPSFALNLSGGPTGAVMAINLYTLQQVPPLPLGGGCFLYGDFTTFVLGITTGQTLPFGIPANLAFMGYELTAPHSTSST